MRASLAVQPFRRLLLSYTLNEFGDWFATIALSILVFERTEDPFATTALFLCAKFVPSALVPALAVRAEKFPVRTVLTAAYAVEAMVFGALAAGLVEAPLAVVFSLALVDGTLAALARATTRAATVTLMAPLGLLREANGTLNIGFSTMNVAGPLAAGIVVETAGGAAALWITAAVFLLLTVAVGTMVGAPGATADESPWLERLRGGFGYLVGHPFAIGLITLQGLLLVLLSMAVPIEVIYAKESLGTTDSGFGLLLAAWGAGMVLGSIIFTRVAHRSLPTLFISSTGAIAVAYIAMAAAPSLAIACAAAALGGLGNGIQWVTMVTSLQEAISADMQNRAAGILEAVVTAVPGVGFVLGGTVTSFTDPRTAFAVAGAGTLVVLSGALFVFRGWDPSVTPQETP